MRMYSAFIVDMNAVQASFPGCPVKLYIIATNRHSCCTRQKPLTKATRYGANAAIAVVGMLLGVISNTIAR